MGFTRLKLRRCQQQYIPSGGPLEDSIYSFPGSSTFAYTPQLWPLSSNLIQQCFLLTSLTLSFVLLFFPYKYPFDHIGLTQIIHYNLPSQAPHFYHICKISFTIYI